MHFAQLGHDLLCTGGFVLCQPVLPKLRDFARQSQHDPACRICARLFSSTQQVLQLMICQPGHNRRRHYANRNTRIGQRSDRLQPTRRRRCAGLHPPGQTCIQRGERYTDPHQSPAGHVSQNIQITLDQCSFGHDCDGVVELLQDLKARPCNQAVFFNGLVWVSVCPDRERGDLVGLCRQFLAQNNAHVGARNKAGFEIQSCGQTQIGVAGSGKTIDAAMLAPSIRVDRTVKRQIG